MARKKRQRQREQQTEATMAGEPAPGVDLVDDLEDDEDEDDTLDGRQEARPHQAPDRPGASSATRTRAASRRTEAREDRRRRAERRKARRRMFYMVGGGIIAAALIGGLLVPSVGPLGGGNVTNNPAGDTPQSSLPSVGTQIAIQPGAGAPPTSGTSEAEPAAWGVHETSIDDQSVLRNLEQGAVVLNHNLSDDAAIAELRTFLESQPGFPGCFVMHPYEAVPAGTVTLTSWGWTQNYTATDLQGMQAFIQDHRNSGRVYVDSTCGSGVGLSAPDSVPHGG